MRFIILPYSSGQRYADRFLAQWQHHWMQALGTRYAAAPPGAVSQAKAPAHCPRPDDLWLGLRLVLLPAGQRLGTVACLPKAYAPAAATWAEAAAQLLATDMQVPYWGARCGPNLMLDNAGHMPAMPNCAVLELRLTGQSLPFATQALPFSALRLLAYLESYA